MVMLWPTTDSILTRWSDRQESAWNSSSLMVWHRQANGLTSILEVSTSNIGRIIGYFYTFHDCFCFLQHIIFIRGSTALVGLVLNVELLRSHSFKHIGLGRTPLDEWSGRRKDLYLTTHTTYIHPPPRDSNRNPSKRVAADPRFRPRGHGHRLATDLPTYSSRMRLTVHLSDLEI